jgi:hypothetical protein
MVVLKADMRELPMVVKTEWRMVAMTAAHLVGSLVVQMAALMVA